MGYAGVMLDFTPVTGMHLLIFGLGFVATYLLLHFLVKQKSGLLRQVPTKPSVKYGGVVPLGVMTVLMFLILDSLALKIGLLAAVFFLIIIGAIDEQRGLKASTQFGWQTVIVLLAVSWGWSFRVISNFRGDGVINLDTLALGTLVLPGAFFAIAWLLLLMNAINWLDGVDGLASGVSTVTFLMLAAVSLLPSIQDPTTLSLALAAAGVMLAFSLWNFSPARVHLGTTGSWFLGLVIGLVALAGGGKVVTTLLILALPVVDFVWVIIQRWRAGQAPWVGDEKRHLHHRLLAEGVSAQTIALSGAALTAIFGILALVLQTNLKIVTLAIVAFVIIMTSWSLADRQRHNSLS